MGLHSDGCMYIVYMYNMEFEWDEEKNKVNLSKHGISFDEAKQIFSGPVLTFLDKNVIAQN